jgi:hypothetical protein
MPETGTVTLRGRRTFGNGDGLFDEGVDRHFKRLAFVGWDDFAGRNYLLDIAQESRHLVTSRQVRMPREIWLREKPGDN